MASKLDSKVMPALGFQPDAASTIKPKADSFSAERQKFLNDFEKPTQIYKYMRARMLQKPIFLYRNLSYMKGRMSRSHQSRKSFKLDDLLKRVEERNEQEQKAKTLLSKKLNYNFLNLIILGFWDGQSWLPDTDAKLDLQIVRICVKKRKDARVPISKVFSESCKIKIRSQTESIYKEEFTFPISKGKYNVMSVPKDCFNLVNGHIVNTIKIIVRVTIPASALLQKSETNNRHSENGTTETTDDKPRSNGRLSSVGRSSNSSSDSTDEPKPKRLRSLPTKDRENFVYDEKNKQNNRTSTDIVYVGVLTIYDKDANVNIPAQGNSDIEFRLNRQEVKKPGIVEKRITQEGSWETSLETNHSKIQEYLLRNGTTGCAAKLALALRGSSEKLKPMVDPPAAVTFSSTVKNSKESLSTEKVEREMTQDNNVRVVYMFVQGANGRQMTESRNDLRCPWCSIHCLLLYSLLKHLKICHPRFSFSFAPIVNGARVDVSINESYDGSYTGSAFDLVSQPPGEAFARNGPAKRTSVFHLITLKAPPSNRSLQEFFDSDEKDAEHRRSYMTGHNRLYHHTTTCLPIHPREIEVDSEGEPDPEWLRVKTMMMLDEFTDVNEGEKEIMKLWNHHVMHDNYVGDCQIPLACKRFVERYGREIVQKNLYRNFVLHLTNLYDFGLLPANGFHATIQVLHSQMKDNNTASSLREAWSASSSSTYPAISENAVEAMEVDASPKRHANGSSTLTTNGSERNGHTL